MCQGLHYEIKNGFVSGQMAACEGCALSYLTWIRKKIFFLKICKWLFLSPTATNSRTGCAAISASAPCVCLICVCSLAITKHGWGGPKSGESGDTERQKAAENTGKTGGCQAGCEKRITPGNDLPVISPTCSEYQRPSSVTNKL